MQWVLKFLAPGAGAAGILGIIEFPSDQWLGVTSCQWCEARPQTGADKYDLLPRERWRKTQFNPY